MTNVSLELLTDDAIVDYSTDENGKPCIITDNRDVNLNFTKELMVIDGGVYDRTIFGSPFVDKCICGKIGKPSPHACPQCGCRVYTVEEGLRKFARIELPFYYLSQLRFEIFKEFFDDVFSDSEIILDFVSPDDLTLGGYSARGKKKLGIKVFDSCQFEYDKKKKTLTISEFITDPEKCSYEGLLKIFEEHFPSRVNELRKLINRYILVLPSLMRPLTHTYDNNGRPVIGFSPITTWYGNLVRLCSTVNKNPNNDAQSSTYASVTENLGSPSLKVRYTALLRAFINVGRKEATELLNTSKENLARNAYTVSSANSARCPIVPDTKLAIDEISVPVHLAYEFCRRGFCEYLEKEKNFTREEARRSTRKEYNNPEIQKLFKEYAEQQVVIRETVPCYVR